MGRVEVTYKTIVIRTASNFSTAKLEGRKKNVFKILWNIDFELRILSPAKHLSNINQEQSHFGHVKTKKTFYVPFP